MKLHFHTNLDEAKPDVDVLSDRVWPKDDMPIPRKGERIRVAFDLGKNFELDVVDVVYLYDAAIPVAHIELHMPSYYASMSIADWSTWFRRHRYGREW
jgi:hypothetical protein